MRWRHFIAITLVLTLGLIAFSWLHPVAGEDQDVSLVNAERIQRGISPLTRSSDLSSIAQRHSDEMAAKGSIWHATWTQDAAEPWTGYGENVGAGPDLQSVHDAFMNSSEHRVNILEPYFKLIGTGTAWKDGIVYVTEIYVTRPHRRPFKVSPRRLAAPQRRRARKDTPRAENVSMLLRMTGFSGTALPPALAAWSGSRL